MNLHEAITASIDEAQAKAERDRNMGWNQAYPTVTLRGLTEDRDILARHRPSDDLNVWLHGESHPACMHGEDDADDIVDAIWWHQCPEILSLARRLGVPS